MHVSDWFPTMLDLAQISSFTPSQGFEMDGVSQVRTPSTETEAIVREG